MDNFPILLVLVLFLLDGPIIELLKLAEILDIYLGMPDVDHVLLYSLQRRKLRFTVETRVTLNYLPHMLDKPHQIGTVVFEWREAV